MGYIMTTKSIIIVGFLFLCICCKNNVKPIIEMDYLKSDWIIRDTAFLNIEDSLILTDLNIRNLERSIVYKYEISKDTLILRRKITRNATDDYKAKLRILKLTKSILQIQFVSFTVKKVEYKPNWIFLFKRDSVLKNNKEIKNFEFTSSNGWG